MKNRIKSVLLLIIFCISFIAPAPIEAKINFRKVFKNIRRGVSFVVSVPDKATRWMGPVLGPIAADLLTQNIIRNPRIGRIFRRAEQFERTMNNVDDQKKYLENVKKNFQDEAENLDKQAQTVRDSQNQLREQLLNRDISFEDYKDKIVSLDRIADSYEAVADKFRNSANKINPSNITRLLTRNVWRNLLVEIKNGVEFELKSEVNKYLDPSIIKSLVEGGNLSFSDLIGSLVAQNVESNWGEDRKFSKDELTDRVTDRVKQILRENREALKNNWMAEIEKIIKEEKQKLQKEKENLEEISPEQEKEEPVEDFAPGTDGCPSGYERCPQCGVDCRQINCNDVASGHWDYVGRCTCGSAGSIAENPEDPNKACYYSNDFESCPGCLYACVHYNEECPKI